MGLLVPPAQAEESAELHGQTWLWSHMMGYAMQSRRCHTMAEPQLRGCEATGEEARDVFSESGLPPTTEPTSFEALPQTLG